MTSLDLADNVTDYNKVYYTKIENKDSKIKYKTSKGREFVGKILTKKGIIDVTFNVNRYKFKTNNFKSEKWCVITIDYLKCRFSNKKVCYKFLKIVESKHKIKKLELKFKKMNKEQ